MDTKYVHIYHNKKKSNKETFTRKLAKHFINKNKNKLIRFTFYIDTKVKVFKWFFKYLKKTKFEDGLYYNIYIELEDTQITLGVLKRIYDVIRYNRQSFRVKGLILYDGVVKIVPILSQIINVSHDIEVLEVLGDEWNDDGNAAMLLQEAICKSNSLQSLRIDNIIGVLKPTFFINIIGDNNTLTVIDIDMYEINPLDDNYVSQFCTALSCNKTLRKLGLSAPKFTTFTTFITFVNFLIDDDKCKLVGIKMVITDVVAIDKSDGYNVAGILSRLVTCGSKRIKSLDFGSKIEDPDNIMLKGLCNFSLSKYIRKYYNLSVDLSKKQDFELFLELLTKSTCLKKLKVRLMTYNYDKDQLCQIAHAIAKNKHLRDVNIRYNIDDDDEYDDIMYTIYESNGYLLSFKFNDPSNVCNGIGKRNMKMYDRARKAAVTLLCIRYFIRDSILSIFPKDVVKLIAKEVYNTRFEIATWQKKKNEKNKLL